MYLSLKKSTAGFLGGVLFEESFCRTIFISAFFLEFLVRHWSITSFATFRVLVMELFIAAFEQVYFREKQLRIEAHVELSV